MLRFAIAVLSLALIFACWHEPAAANITSATMSTMTPSYNGACPATIQFTATISGTKNTIFTYAFNRFINGKQQLPLNYVGPITMPQSGTYSVNDSMQISSNTSPQTADQIYIISGGQQVYSNTTDAVNMPNGMPTSFTVKCNGLTPNVVNQVAPTPTPKPKLGGAVIQAYHDAPAYVQQTTSGQDCGDHGGGFACTAFFPNGDLVLIWCYGNGPQPCKGTVSSSTAQLFRIYEVDHGQHALIGPPGIQAYNDGTIATVGGVPPPNGGFTNQCYMVVAVDQGKEYGNDTICLGNGSVGPFTTVLHPSATATRELWKQYGTGLPFRAACAPVCVGWQHDQSSIIAPNIIPIWWYADNYRGYYKFDLSSVAGHYVISATLKIPIDSGDPSCFSAIAQANADWTNSTDFVGGDFYNPGGSLNFGMDVTSIVRSWINGNPNNGFVLRGSNENLVAESTQCRVSLDDANAELDIVHS